MKTLQEIMAGLTAAAEVIKTEAAAVAGTVERRQFTAENKAKVAAEALPLIESHGYKVAALTFGKADAAGRRPVHTTYRIPMSFKERLAQYEATKAALAAARLAPKVAPTAEQVELKKLQVLARKLRTRIKLAKELANDSLVGVAAAA